MGWEAGERFKTEGTYVYLWQKPTQHCKAIIFQLKINHKKRPKNESSIMKRNRYMHAHSSIIHNSRRYPQMNEWINKMWSIHTREYYQALKIGNSDTYYNTDEP